MTNKEAIAIIRSECYIANLLNLDRTQMVNTALDKAVEALEQQSCGDCILDETDACPRGAGRAVDDEICEEFLQEPCEDADYEYPLTMPTEEYRLRMIRAFHNADCDELIALVVIPTEKEFEHLEWLLKTHYKETALRRLYQSKRSNIADSAVWCWLF